MADKNIDKIFHGSPREAPTPKLKLMTAAEVSEHLEKGDFHFKWNSGSHLTKTYKDHKEHLLAVFQELEVDCRYFVLHLLTLMGASFDLEFSFMTIMPPHPQVRCICVLDSDYDCFPIENKNQWVLRLNEEKDEWWGMHSKGPTKLTLKGWVERVYKDLLTELEKGYIAILEKVFEKDVRKWGCYTIDEEAKFHLKEEFTTSEEDLHRIKTGIMMKLLKHVTESRSDEIYTIVYDGGKTIITPELIKGKCVVIIGAMHHRSLADLIQSKHNLCIEVIDPKKEMIQGKLSNLDLEIFPSRIHAIRGIPMYPVTTVTHSSHPAGSLQDILEPGKKTQKKLEKAAQKRRK